MLSTWWYTELVNAVSRLPVWLRKPQGEDQPVVGSFLAGFLFILLFFLVGGIKGEHRYHVVETGGIGAPGKYFFQHFICFFSWPHISPLWNKLTTCFQSVFEILCAGSCLAYSKTCLILQYSCWRASAVMPKVCKMVLHCCWYCDLSVQNKFSLIPC